MKKFRWMTSVALLGISFAALGSTAASARIACNDEGDCWHTTTVYEYPSDAHIVLHDDDWKWHEGEHFGWREHEGRGFWRNHSWTAF